jgi:mRNA interferase MazF
MLKLEPDKIDGLSKTSSDDCFQVRSLSQERLIKKLGNIDITTLDKIKEALKKVFSI